MPRVPNSSTQCKILRDVKTGTLYVRDHDTVGDGRRLRSDVAAVASRYQDVGTMRQRADADFFVLTAELGLSPDAIAYLKQEHDLGDLTGGGSKISVSEEELEKRCRAIREETGRTCFGRCDSLGSSQACALCYLAQRATWSICAQVSSLNHQRVRAEA